MKHFTLRELCASETAVRKNIKNVPNKEEIENLNKLVDNILDPIREKYGKPVIINSGFRCQKLNDTIGGSKTSDHRFGKAADIRSVSNTLADNRKLFDLIDSMNLDYDQLIYEAGDNVGPAWIHISFRSHETNRHQKLRMKKINGKTTYSVMK